MIVQIQVSLNLSYPLPLNVAASCDIAKHCDMTVLAVSSQDSIHQGSRYQHPHRPPAGGAVPWCTHGPQRQRLRPSGGGITSQPLRAGVRQPAQLPR